MAPLQQKRSVYEIVKHQFTAWVGCKFKEILNWGRLIFGGSLYMIDGNKVITRRLRRNVK